MSWVTPKTWTAGEVVGETDMNTHVRDNLNYLFAPSFQQIITGSAGNLSTTASTAIPISTANLSLTLTTYGGNIHAHFAGAFSGGGADVVHIGMTYDATDINPSTGLMAVKPGSLSEVSIDVWITGLASGSHTFLPTWRVEAGNQTAVLFLATAPATFWVREG
jgi:hypothetical protein